MLRICFSLCASYRRAFVYRRLSRSIIVIQAIHAHLRCGRLSCGGQGAVLKPGRWRQEEVGEGQLIRKILLLIRAITQCHNYQCHQLVCNYFFFFFFCCIPGQTDALCASVCVCVCVFIYSLRRVKTMWVCLCFPSSTITLTRLEMNKCSWMKRLRFIERRLLILAAAPNTIWTRHK